MIVDTTKINGVPIASIASGPPLTTMIRLDCLLLQLVVSHETAQRMSEHALSNADIERLIVAHLDAQEPKQEQAQ